MPYNHQQIEQKWRATWQKTNLYQTPKLKPGDKKKYVLECYPYPSGSGLHVGHCEPYTASDITARYYRAKGYKVLYPMGWDAFGLPSENFAIKTGTHPKSNTQKAIANYKNQVSSLGCSYDWQKEVDTSDLKYYKWTQWLFNLMYKKGLAYQKEASVNWDPVDKTVIANEQVLPDGTSERSGAKVERRMMKQWFLKITDYIEDRIVESGPNKGKKMTGLLNGLQNQDWPESSKTMQHNWIGKSIGSLVDFKVNKPRILLASHNPDKISRHKEYLKNLEISLVSSHDLGFKVDEIEENGNNEIENAKLKAKHYFETCKEISLSLDSGLYIEGLKDEDQPKKDVQGKAGVNFGDSDEIRWQKMTSYYQEIAKNKGGQVSAYFLDVYCLYDGNDYYIKTSKRHFILTDKLHGKHQHFPLTDLYLVNDIPYHDLDKAQMENFLEPSTQAVKSLIAEFLAKYPAKITIFTTRIDTLFAGTFLLLAPEHPLVSKLTTPKQKIEVDKYLEKTKLKSNLERTDLSKDWTGVFTGSFVINPATNEEIPVWIADFVLPDYGTGAVFADSHDDRDFYLAKKYGLSLKLVLLPKDKVEAEKVKNLEICYNGEPTDILINSSQFDGLTSEKAKTEILAWGEQNGWAKAKVTYRLRDWSIGRQRYWGCPIPIIYKPEPKPEILQEMEFGKTLDNEEYRSGSFAVVFDPTTQKYACWEYEGKWGLAGGGQENGQSLEETAKQEVIEELGLTDIKEVYQLGAKIKVHYRHFSKNLNRLADPTPFLVILNSNKTEKAQLQSHEQGMELVWTDSQTMLNKLIEDSTEETTRLHYAEGLKRGVSLAICMNLDTTSDPQIFDKYTLKTITDDNLPVVLPEDVALVPSGRSPLIDHQEFHNQVKTKYGELAYREADTMDTFVDSSWYFFRYCSNFTDSVFAEAENLKNWMPVDFYICGAEHANLHLLYARFFTKVLFDEGLIDFDEPFYFVRHQGLILGSDGRKMSKRWGNVVNPDDMFSLYGADSLRMYEMFMGPLEQPKPWSDTTLKGVRRFLDKVWTLSQKTLAIEENSQIETGLHYLIKKVSEDIENFSYNTAVSEFMKFSNLVDEIDKKQQLAKENTSLTLTQLTTFLQILAPFAPFITEEIYQNLPIINKLTSIHLQTWPIYDETKLISNEVKYAIQINGKVRGEFLINKDSMEQEILAKAKEKTAKWLENKTIKFTKVIPNKLVTIVVG